MKKLSAGIFASILGLTAIGAADAAVTSKQYVDNAIDAAKTAVTQSIAGDYATKDALTAETNARTQADSTLQGNIDTLTTNTTNALADKADKSYVGTIPSTSLSTNVVDYVVEKTSGIASEGAITELDGRLDIIEGDYVTEQELADSQAAQNTNITAAANAASAADAKADNAQTTADNAVAAASTADGKAVAAQTAANEAKDAAATADGKAVAAQTTANEAKDAASAADGKAVAAQTTANEAKDAATAADTKAGNAQTAANEAKDAAAANATAIEGKLSADDAAATYELKANVSGAPNDTDAGKYVLTKIVTQGEGGVEVVSYGWELIDRDYDPASEGTGGGHD